MGLLQALALPGAMLDRRQKTVNLRFPYKEQERRHVFTKEDIIEIVNNRTAMEKNARGQISSVTKYTLKFKDGKRQFARLTKMGHCVEILKAESISQHFQRPVAVMLRVCILCEEEICQLYVYRFA